MTGWQYAILIAAAAIGTMFTRFTPFLAFGGEKPAPKYVRYLGKALPGAALGLLVIYCLKNVNIMTGDHGIPVFIAMLLTVAIHIWKRQMLLSIAAGTVVYVLLINFVAWS